MDKKNWEKLIKHTPECMSGMGCTCDHHDIIHTIRFELAKKDEEIKQLRDIIKNVNG